MLKVRQKQNIKKWTRLRIVNEFILPVAGASRGYSGGDSAKTTSVAGKDNSMVNNSAAANKKTFDKQYTRYKSSIESAKYNLQKTKESIAKGETLIKDQLLWNQKYILLLAEEKERVIFEIKRANTRYL